MLFDIYQQHRISEASAAAESAKDKVQALRNQVDDLQRKTDALSITCQALWELLRAATNLTDQDMLQKMQEIDLRDGRLDGRIKSPPVNCPSCQRITNGERRACLYCGVRIPGGNIFEKI